jgi:hypothetical protein
MRGYSRCVRHLEGDEKARYDREQQELARAEAKRDAARASRKRERSAPSGGPEHQVRGPKGQNGLPLALSSQLSAQNDIAG